MLDTNTMKTVYIDSTRYCDIDGCKDAALYDAPTTMGSWAYLCSRHMGGYGARSAFTLGSRLVVGEAPVKSDADKRTEIMQAIESGDFDLAEDLIGDGDIAEWL